MMIVYKTINIKNDKIYIGIDSKHNPNYLGSGLYFKRAVKKYGRENFKKEILEECKTIKELNDREIYWIYKLNSTNHNIGYNISIGGYGGNLGEEINKKKSKSLIGHFVSDETRRKISESNKGKAKWLNGRILTREHRNNISKNHADISGRNNPMFGKKHTEETKKLQREKARGRYTLDWFIQRYGEEIGKEKYKKNIEQCRQASILANKKRWHGELV